VLQRFGHSDTPFHPFRDVAPEHALKRFRRAVVDIEAFQHEPFLQVRQLGRLLHFTGLRDPRT